MNQFLYIVRANFDLELGRRRRVDMSEKQTKPGSKNGLSVYGYAILITGVILTSLTVYMNCSSSMSKPSFKPESAYFGYDLIDDPSLEEYLDILRRDDDKKSSTSYSQAPPKPLLKQPGIQFAFALAGFVVLNMIAICIHHVYHLASRSTKSYRNVLQDISPF